MGHVAPCGVAGAAGPWSTMLPRGLVGEADPWGSLPACGPAGAADPWGSQLPGARRRSLFAAYLRASCVNA